MRRRKEKIHGKTMTLAGWSDAGYGDQPSLGKCRLGYAVGLMASTPSGPCHIIPWASKSTRKLAKSSLGGEVYAFSEMLGHMSMFPEFYGHCLNLYPGMVGLEDCESLFTDIKKKQVVAETFLVRHFLAIQRTIEMDELYNAYWIPGFGSPPGGLTKLKSDLVPPLRLIESGSYSPGTLRPSNGVAFREQ